MTAEAAAAHQAKHGRARSAKTATEKTTVEAPKRSKYGNRKTWRDGFAFDSELEANRYTQIRLLVAAGEVVGYHRQPMYDLPGGRVYKADFVVYWADGSKTVEDCKGCDDPMSKLKRDQVEDIWKVKITLLRSQDVKVGAG